MTVFYVDPIGGDNTKNGQSFANRVKTISALATSSTDFSDEIRYIEDVPDTSLGNFTFTNGDFGLVPAAALDVVPIFSGTVAWTAVVSPANSTLSSALAAQANGYRITATSSSPIGKICHYTLPATLNLSAYQSLSFLMNGTHYLTALDLKLCSDADGNVPIASFRFLDGVGYDAAIDGALPDTSQQQLATNQLLPLVFRGVTLPDGVNSIAVYRRAVVPSGDFGVANLIASKTGGIDHACLVGKKTVAEPAWYSIRTITPDLIEIGANLAKFSDRSNGFNWRGYYGVAESAELWMKRPYLSPYLSTSRVLPNNGAHFHFGGYNRTDMSTKTGVTSYHSAVGSGNPIINPGKYVAGMDSFNFINQLSQIVTHLQGELNNIGLISKLSSSTLVTSVTTKNLKKRMHFTQITQCPNPVVSQETAGYAFEAVIDLIKDPCCTNGTVPSVSLGQAVRNVDPLYGARNYRVRKISNGLGEGIQTSNGIQLVGPTIWENMKAGVKHISAPVDGTGPVNCTGYPPETEVVITSSSYTGVVTTEYLLATAAFKAEFQSALNHGSVARSPKMTLHTSNLYPTAQGAALVSVAQIFVEAGKTLTFKMWDRGDTLVASTRSVLMVKAFNAAGVEVDTIVESTPTVGVWTERTLTISPTADCIINVEAGICGLIGGVILWSDPSWTIT